MTAHAHLFKGKRVLLRLDLNVPLILNEVRSDYRIKMALPTINFLRTHGARVIILSHIGKGREGETLQPVAEYLSQMMPLSFLTHIRDEKNAEVIGHMQDGDVVLLENLRFDTGEFANDTMFSQYLASLGDYYVNDAFSTAHRTHASIVGIPRHLPSFAGMRLAEEAAELSRALEPEHPCLFILGGRKIATKLPLIEKLVTQADHVFIGGVIANDFLYARGQPIGVSSYDESALPLIAPYATQNNILTPIDVVAKSGKGMRTIPVKDIAEDELIVDVGPETIASLDHLIGEAKFIVWSGPLGHYEGGYLDGSRELFERIMASRAYAIVGGGDTVALIESMDGTNRFGFVSTGGGAMIEFIANGTLPGLEALGGLGDIHP
jgi:phosphoglycerate kinase